MNDLTLLAISELIQWAFIFLIILRIVHRQNETGGHS